MSEPMRQLVAALPGVKCVLADFDGPFCAVFAGLPADQVAVRLVERLSASGHKVHEGWRAESDPFTLLHRIDREAPELVAAADAILVELETEAARRARPNADMAPMLDACAESGRSVIVVSNNAGPAIDAYLEQQGLADRVDRVVGRAASDPSSMKPSPRLLLDAMGTTDPATCVFIGDSVRDVEAGHAAGVPTIGYANKPGKDKKLSDAAAVVVVPSIADITEALRMTPVDASS
ncbi:HAD family hydrolase [Streptomyces xiamenensis]|uniref:HAD family hydrolase n=1 Tax=Streptomyces xiamenensis TaxID=408015 RepID=UPI003696578B